MPAIFAALLFGPAAGTGGRALHGEFATDQIAMFLGGGCTQVGTVRTCLRRLLATRTRTPLARRLLGAAHREVPASQHRASRSWPRQCLKGAKSGRRTVQAPERSLAPEGSKRRVWISCGGPAAGAFDGARRSAIGWSFRYQETRVLGLELPPVPKFFVGRTKDFSGLYRERLRHRYRKKF